MFIVGKSFFSEILSKLNIKSIAPLIKEYLDPNIIYIYNWIDKFKRNHIDFIFLFIFYRFCTMQLEKASYLCISSTFRHIHQFGRKHNLNILTNHLLTLSNKLDSVSNNIKNLHNNLSNNSNHFTNNLAEYVMSLAQLCPSFFCNFFLILLEQVIDEETALTD